MKIGAPRKHDDKKVLIPLYVEKKKIDLLGRTEIIQLCLDLINEAYHDNL